LEIEHAVKHNKRLVPVVWKEVEDNQVHSAMTAHNWVFLRKRKTTLRLLISALDTDLDYVREHTRLLTLAIEWDKNQRRRSAVLRGQELQASEGWLQQSGSKDPQPAELHREYLTFSRTVVDQFQRLMISSFAVAFVCLLGVLAFALKQKIVAEKANQISTSRALAAFALAEMETDPELSLLLATESIGITRRGSGVVLPLSNTVLRSIDHQIQIQIDFDRS